MTETEAQPDATEPQRQRSPGITQSALHDATTAPDLVRMIRYDGTIYAHEFCRVCGIKPNTLRMSRLRGKGPSSQRVSNNRVVISLRDAAAWLQSTDMVCLWVPLSLGKRGTVYWPQ